jgi:hypothetical protein
MIRVNAELPAVREHQKDRGHCIADDEALEREIARVESELENADRLENATQLGFSVTVEKAHLGKDFYCEWMRMEVNLIFKHDDGYVYFSNGQYGYSPRLHLERSLTVLNEFKREREEFKEKLDQPFSVESLY